MSGLAMTLYAIDEPRPGPRWQALFDATWWGLPPLVPA